MSINKIVARLNETATIAQTPQVKAVHQDIDRLRRSLAALNDELSMFSAENLGGARDRAQKLWVVFEKADAMLDVLHSNAFNADRLLTKEG